MDWETAPAFAEVDLKTTDQSRVKLDSLEMKVASSEAYRKPMLSISEHYGCVGFRPDFSIVNNGWGDVKDMKMSIQFTRTDEEDNATGEPSRMFTKDIGTFGDGVDVSVKNVLAEAGVDTATLETERFTCPSRDSLNVCRAQVANKVKFGDVADYISGSVEKMSVTGDRQVRLFLGRRSGRCLPAERAVSRRRLAGQHRGSRIAGRMRRWRRRLARKRCATRTSNFRSARHDYSIPMPVRGNKNLSSYTARLKMWSSMSSIHRFSIAAHFADGSTRESKPATFFYFKPKQSLFETKTKPAACYLPADLQGC